jgi:hypothetical protein
MLEYQKLALQVYAPVDNSQAVDILNDIKYIMFPHLKDEADEKDRVKTEAIEKEAQYQFKFYKDDLGNMNAFKEMLDGD